ncbi:MAG: Glu/Leu/Phe/Val dehydrogenase dimerization domain-containing protein [Gemmatimonadota bacterium]
MSDSLQRRISEWDGEAVVCRFEPDADAWIFVALHDATLGTPVGGTRIRVYESPEAGLVDAMRLAAGMTCKWAAVELPFGGGKAVLCLSRALSPEERKALLREYGRLLRTLHGAFATGVDLGTTPQDMRIVAQESEHVMGGCGIRSDPGPYTALGVLSGIRAGLRHALDSEDVAGRRVLVQGVGDVGLPLARMLAEAGARVLLSDVDEPRAARAATELGGTVVEAARVSQTPCDVYAPCAVGGVLNERTIPRLRCRLVAGSANNQLLEPADADRLHDLGILYAPDYIINAGGAIAFGRMHLGVEDDEAIREEIRGIGSTLEGIFLDAERSGRSPAHAATRRVERVLEAHRVRGSAAAPARRAASEAAPAHGAD